MMHDQALAKTACSACHRLKRKCTRELPRCALCKRVGRCCDYSASPATPSSLARSATRRESHESAHRWRDPAISPRQTYELRSAPSPRTSSIATTRFPAAWFLDSVYCRGSQMALPEAPAWDVLVHEPACLTVEQAQNAAEQYFATTQTWLPISKATISSFFSNPISD